MSFLDSAGDFFKGIGSAVTDAASTIGDIGKGVADFVVDRGKDICNGAKTLVTDPKKFISDVGDGLGEWGRHIVEGAKSGADMIAEGWNDVKQGGNPLMLVTKTVGGLGQIASLGATDAVGEYLDEHVTADVDAMGNVSGYTVDEGANGVVKAMNKMFGKTVATTVNANNEIEEALAEGDAKKANQIFGDTAWVTIGRPVAKAASVAAIPLGIAAAPLTGGTSVALSAASIACLVAPPVIDAVADSKEAKFDAENMADDSNDIADEKTEAMLASGQITEEQAGEYRNIVQKTWSNNGYKSLCPDYAAQAGYGSVQEMEDALLAAYGLPTSAEGGTLMASNDQVAAMYQGAYETAAGKGVVTGAQGAQLAALATQQELGQGMTQREYIEAVCDLHLQNADISDAERGRLVGWMADYSEGKIDDAQFASNLSNDKDLSRYITEDGLFDPPVKADCQATLQAGVSSREAPSAGQEAQPAAGWSEVQAGDEDKAAENQAIIAAALGYA